MGFFFMSFEGLRAFAFLRFFSGLVCLILPFVMTVSFRGHHNQVHHDQDCNAL